MDALFTTATTHQLENADDIATHFDVNIAQLERSGEPPRTETWYHSADSTVRYLKVGDIPVDPRFNPLHKVQEIHLGLSDQDCVTPEMVASRTNTPYEEAIGPVQIHLQGGIGPLRFEKFGFAFQFIGKGAYRGNLVLTGFGSNLSSDTCVWSFTIHRYAKN